MLLQLDALPPLPAAIAAAPADSAPLISADDLRRALASKAHARCGDDARLELAQQLAAALACALGSRPTLAVTRAQHPREAVPTGTAAPATPTADPMDGRLGTGAARFCAAPAVFILSAVEMLVPAAAPVRGLISGHVTKELAES